MNVEIPEDELLELQRQAALGRLLAGVAHEFSAPIGSIRSNRDLCLRLFDRIERSIADPIDPRTAELLSAGRELARVDLLAAERISHLIRSLKVAARVPDPEPQSANINEIVESAVRLGKTQFRDRIAVETAFGTLPEVECYPHLLIQAVLNLVINASQAIEGDGKITAGTELESHPDGDLVHLWISDTGQGIREEDQPKVLKQGFTTKPVGIGTGLGLLMVRRAVTDDHGGTIGFESRWGHGTTFHIRIPLKQKKKGVE
jgi:signal transduction histidine kinase